MANGNLTEVVVLIDSSGSMGIIKSDTIGGFNTFLEEQKKSVDGKAKFTVVFFDTSVRTYANGIDVNEVKPLDEFSYRTNGGTSLLDAIGITINTIEERYTNEEDDSKIPSKVIFAIITDGEENTSTRFVKSDISKLIKHQTKRHGWEFAFLGANLDAVNEAESIGISKKSAFNFAATGQGINDSYSVLSGATSSYRNSGSADYNISGTSLDAMNSKVTIDNGGNLTTQGKVKIEDTFDKMNPSNI